MMEVMDETTADCLEEDDENFQFLYNGDEPELVEIDYILSLEDQGERIIMSAVVAGDVPRWFYLKPDDKIQLLGTVSVEID